MKRVAVLGGTGFVGRHVCEKLQRQGFTVTVPTRRQSQAQSIRHLPQVTVIQVNPHDPVELEGLLHGHDAVVNLIAILHGDEAGFERVHVTLPATLAAACKNSGVQRLIHISALGADLDAPSMYQRSKARGEQVLRSAGLALSILRPSVIFGSGDRFLNMFASLQSVFPVMPLAGASTRFQPVWVEDVAAAVLACIKDTELPLTSIGQTFECAGPDVLTLAELVRLSGRLGSHQRPIIPLPMLVGRLQAMAMELLPGEPLMSRDNVDSMKTDNVATGQWPGLAALGIAPASVLAIAPQYLGARGGRADLNRFRSGER